MPRAQGSSTMSCSRLDNEDLLFEPGDSLDPHVEKCGDCRERLLEYQQIAHWIAVGKTAIRVPPDWKRRTIARVHTTQTRRRRRILGVSACTVMVGAAAVLLVTCPHP